MVFSITNQPFGGTPIYGNPHLILPNILTTLDSISATKFTAPLQAGDLWVEMGLKQPMSHIWFVLSPLIIHIIDRYRKVLCLLSYRFSKLTSPASGPPAKKNPARGHRHQRWCTNQRLAPCRTHIAIHMNQRNVNITPSNCCHSNLAQVHGSTEALVIVFSTSALDALTYVSLSFQTSSLVKKSPLQCEAWKEKYSAEMCRACQAGASVCVCVKLGSRSWRSL